METRLMNDAVTRISESVSKRALTIDDIANHYDAVVVGAGPAGTLASRQLARQGIRVLLVDKNTFPRSKVCGCCLSRHSLDALKQCGLKFPAEELASPWLHTLKAAANGREIDFDLPQPSQSVSRATFDAWLVNEAMQSGVQFLHSAKASVSNDNVDSAQVELRVADNQVSIRANIVVVADGLGGTALNSITELTPSVVPGSRIGAGAVISDAPAFYQAGTIYMAYGSHGYVGLVRVEKDAVDIAAALDSDHVRSSGSPSAAMSELIDEAGWPVPDGLTRLHLKGTVPLTRKRPAVASHRLFVVGDSASYVEPFTGEGIAWALESARLVAPLAARGAGRWDDSLIWHWEHTYRRTIRRRQHPTKLISALLRQPTAALTVADLLHQVPILKRSVVNMVSGGGKTSR